MRNMRSHQPNFPDLDRMGFRPLNSPSNIQPSELDNRHRSSSASIFRPFSASASSNKSSSNSATVQSDHEFAEDALKVHNELRRRHGVEPLRLNSDLSKLAQQWGKYSIYLSEYFILNGFFLLANHLASTGSLVHSKTKYKNINVGENLRCQSWPMTG